MKIALVANSFPTASETFIYNHAAGLQSRGVDVTVFTLRASTDANMFVDFDGVRYTGSVRPLALQPARTATLRAVARLLATSTNHALDLWRRAQSMYGVNRRAVRTWLLALPFEGFDIVHIEYSGLAAELLDALPLLSPSCVVCSCRGAAEQITPVVDAGRASLLRTVFDACDLVHCVSDDMQRTCEAYGLDPAKAFVNRPAIDVGRFRRSSPYVARTTGPYRLLSTGRLHWKKGLEYALGAVRQLLDQGHLVHYSILGGGADEEKLRFTARDLGLESNVSFLGRQSSTAVRAALETADVYLLPSLSEGLSNAALEAMAMALPVVSTTAGGMAEAIEDGTSGIIVAPRDVAGMAAGIASLLAEPERRLAVGLAARARVEAEFSIQRQMDVYLRVYSKLLG